jgi:transcriptional regulator of acetoin/glycerol metabolism
MDQVLLDPTPEDATALRAQAAPLDDLTGQVIGLLDISKPRGNVYLDEIARLLGERGVTVERYVKPTHARPAPMDLRLEIARNCAAVIEALAD